MCGVRVRERGDLPSPHLWFGLWLGGGGSLMARDRQRARALLHQKTEVHRREAASHVEVRREQLDHVVALAVSEVQPELLRQPLCRTSGGGGDQEGCL